MTTEEKATRFCDTETDGTPRFWSVLLIVVNGDGEEHTEQSYYIDRVTAEALIEDLRPAQLGLEEEMTILLLRRVGDYWTQITRENYTWQDNLEDNS